MGLFISTRNLDKVKEINWVLKPLHIKVLSILDFPDIPEVKEDGKTYKENAIKKALAGFEHTGLPSLGEDSGLEVESLGGRPGILSSRFAGPPFSSERNNEKLLSLLDGVPMEERKASFVCFLALKRARDEEPILQQGICPGSIATGPKGEKGFGYDPLFIPMGYKRTFGELGLRTKGRISHRAVALRKLLPYLKDNREKDDD